MPSSSKAYCQNDAFLVVTAREFKRPHSRLRRVFPVPDALPSRRFSVASSTPPEPNRLGAPPADGLP
jgi:hypothetical protein